MYIYLSHCDMQPVFGRDTEKNNFLVVVRDLRPIEGIFLRASTAHFVCLSLCLSSISPTLFLSFISRRFLSLAGLFPGFVLYPSSLVSLS